MTLSAFAAERRAAALLIDISCPHGARQQTRRTPLLLLIDGTDRQTDRQTDGRTDARPFHRMWVVSIILTRDEFRFVMFL